MVVSYPAGHHRLWLTPLRAEGSPLGATTSQRPAGLAAARAELAFPRISRNSFGNLQALQNLLFWKFCGNLHAPAETVSRIFQDTHVQSHFGGRCGVPPPQARKILPKTGPFSSKSTILCVSLGLPGSGAGADIEIFGLDPHQIFLRTSHGRCGKLVRVCVWKFPEIFPEKR